MTFPGKRGFVFGVGLVLACGFAAVLLWPQPQVVVLGNGNRLILEKVTFGTNHVYSGAPPFVDPLFRTVPVLRRLLHSSPRICQVSSEEQFCLWLSEFNTQSGLYVSGRWAVHVADDHGCIFQAGASHWRNGQGAKQIRPVVLGAWPRRQPTFSVNVFDQLTLGGSPVGTFIVRNPRRLLPVASVEAKPLPVETAAGSLTVRLVQVMRLARPPNPPHIHEVFEFFEQGRKSQDWQLTGLSWSDASGNHTLRGESVALCVQERVWMLQACAFKEPQAEFPPENLWGLPVLDLPGPGQFLPLSLTTNLQGARLSMLGLAGPGRVVYSNGVPVLARAPVRTESGLGISFYSDRIEVECSSHHLALECVGLAREQRLDLRCRQLPSGKAGPYLQTTAWPGTCRFYPLKVDPSTKSILVEAIVQSGHRIEFSVRPPTR